MNPTTTTTAGTTGPTQTTGSGDPERAEFNACQWLIDRHLRDGRGDRVAVRCEGESHTYSDIHAEVRRAASGLRALGVRPEERVAMVMLDSVEFVATFLGGLRVGAVPVLVNPLLPPRDLAATVADSRARVLVISQERAAGLEELLAGAPEVQAVVTTAAPDPASDPSTIAWADFTGHDDDSALHPTWAESPGFWLCTSGTTGRPKLAMHRHGDLLTTVDTYARRVLSVTEDDRFFSVGPMFHAYGLGNSLTFPFAVGATSIIEPTRPPTPDLVARLVTTERPTLFFCVPTFYAALNATELPDDTFESVRYGVSAAESLPAETFERFRDRYGVTILDGIGSTELLHIFLSNTPEKVAAGTSGVAVPGYEVRVVDDDGNDIAPGEAGHLLVKGDSAATGYWCRADTTRATFQGRWVHTGDLYTVSEDGFHTYLGRSDDMLRVGGEWVSPAEVEAVLMQSDGVLEAAVVGERDDAGVMRPVAHVIPASGADPAPEDLIAFCRDRLAGYKRPRRIELVSELPKTATGKIQRYRLRDG